MTQAAQLAQYGANNVGLSFKNRIINGAMQIDQRNAGASVAVTTASQYTLDRWAVASSTSFGGQLTAQRSTIAPTGFINSLGLTVTTADSSIGATEYYAAIQRIEGNNIADLGWGTANAQTVTMSFWVRSSLTGTFGGSLRNNDSNRSYVFTYTISSANTWEYKTITIVGDTTGTWLTDNGCGIDIFWSVGTGSTYRSSTVSSWQSGVFLAPSSQTQLIGTSGATFYITGVQLEKGSTATSFDYRPYGTELALCQRYYEKSYNPNDVAGTANATGYAASPVASNTVPIGQSYSQVSFNTSKRAAPTVTLYGYSGGSGKVSHWNTGVDFAASSGISYSISTQGFNAYNGSGATLSTSNFGIIYQWIASIEL